MLQDSSAVVSDGFWDELDPLLDFGIRVVPINGRKPLLRGWDFGRIKNDGTWGRSSATTNRERLESKFGGPEGPAGDHLQRPGVAIPTGQPWGNGLFTLVIDVDGERGGNDGFIGLCSKLGSPPQTAHVRTPTEESFHLHFLSRGQWHGLPAELRRGVELKRAGHFVVAPPTPGYQWVKHPAQVGLAWWQELDNYLSAGLRRGETTAPRPELLEARASWSDCDDCLAAIMLAPEGERTQALLEYGGRVAYWAALGRGYESREALEAALWKACLSNGLVDEYGETEAWRKIVYVGRLADPAENPYLNGTAPREPFEASDSLLSRGGGRRGLCICPLLGMGWRADAAVNGWAVLRDLGVFKGFKPYSRNYAAKRLGIPPKSAYNALLHLEDDGLITRGPSKLNLTRDGSKSRATYTWSVTPQGRALLRGVTS